MRERHYILLASLICALFFLLVVSNTTVNSANATKVEKVSPSTQNKAVSNVAGLGDTIETFSKEFGKPIKNVTDKYAIRVVFKNKSNENVNVFFTKYNKRAFHLNINSPSGNTIKEIINYIPRDAKQVGSFKRDLDNDSLEYVTYHSNQIASILLKEYEGEYSRNKGSFAIIKTIDKKNIIKDISVGTFPQDASEF